MLEWLNINSRIIKAQGFTNIEHSEFSKNFKEYRITGNFCGVKFCGFGLKRRHLISADWKSWHRKKKLFVLQDWKQQQKRWNDKQLVLITVILRSKNIFSSLESFQRLQLLNTHLVQVNFKFVLRNYFFTVFAIYFVDRKYEVNSWIDKELWLEAIVFNSFSIMKT